MHTVVYMRYIEKVNIDLIKVVLPACFIYFVC